MLFKNSSQKLLRPENKFAEDADLLYCDSIYFALNAK